MAPNQKAWLVNKSSKLGKLDTLVDILRAGEAWALLDKEEREKLYSMLPEPRKGEPRHDIDVHPMQTIYGPYIEAEIRRWQDDLKEGKESKAWREQAIQAGRDKENGDWDEWKEAQRELDWGVKEESAGEDEQDGEASGKGVDVVNDLKDGETKEENTTDEIENTKEEPTEKEKA